ncbi:hypothetical protein MPLB_1890009 [Mesorhizobium sp. ORS 3324]|nr:hypothetical protein MPLB_1890009 [Mesorhizobium sp. ORS 3324]CDX38202.1 hypothetical protein MPLA_2140038 [Mesorhizobium sp. ORS 3359]
MEIMSVPAARREPPGEHRITRLAELAILNITALRSGVELNAPDTASKRYATLGFVPVSGSPSYRR